MLLLLTAEATTGSGLLGRLRSGVGCVSNAREHAGAPQIPWLGVFCEAVIGRLFQVRVNPLAVGTEH